MCLLKTRTWVTNFCKYHGSLRCNVCKDKDHAGQSHYEWHCRFCRDEWRSSSIYSSLEWFNPCIAMPASLPSFVHSQRLFLASGQKRSTPFQACVESLSLFFVSGVKLHQSRVVATLEIFFGVNMSSLCPYIGSGMLTLCGFGSPFQRHFCKWTDSSYRNLYSISSQSTTPKCFLLLKNLLTKS